MGPPNEQAHVVVLYDGDCGFCKACMGLLLLWDTRHRLYPAEIQGTQGQSLLSSVPDAERLTSAHVVTGDGELISGAKGAPTLLRQLPGGGWLAWLSAATMPVVEAAYRVVTRSRSLLGRFVPRGWAVRADQRISERRRGTIPPTAARYSAYGRPRTVQHRRSSSRM